MRRNPVPFPHEIRSPTGIGNEGADRPADPRLVKSIEKAHLWSFGKMAAIAEVFVEDDAGKCIPKQLAVPATIGIRPAQGPAKTRVRYDFWTGALTAQFVEVHRSPPICPMTSGIH
jgi:hypothetical protein